MPQLYYIGAIQQGSGGGGSGGAGPIANPDSSTTNEGQAHTVPVMLNDSHLNGDPIYLLSATVDPAEGIVTVNTGAGTVVYTPATGFAGNATISYTIRDDAGRTASSTHTVQVQALDPIASSDTGTTNEATPITVDVVANDSHPGGDSFTVTAVSVPGAQGTVVNNNDGTITYTPAAGFTGSATVSYTITDSDGGTDSSTVAISVVDVAPVAVDDSTSVAENSSVLIDVLANDTHGNSDTLTIASASVLPAQGTVTIESGQIRFTPAANFNGTATIDYTVQDESGSTDAGQATVTVIPDPAPVASPDSATTPYNTTVDVDVVANDTHSGMDALTVVSATLLTGSGTVSIVSNMVRFAPAFGFSGDVTISYVVEDTNTDQDSAVVTVTVQAGNDPTAVADTASGDEDTTILVAVLANDTHPDNDPLTLESVTLLTGNGTATVNGNQLQFVPSPDWNGTATFEYVVEDSDGGQDTGTVTITVNPVDDDPTAVGDTGSMPEGTTQSFDPRINDTHPDGDTLSIVAASVSAAAGSVTFTSTAIDFTPLAGFTGAATISYTVEDSNGDQDSSSLIVTVTAVVPVAVDDTASTDFETMVSIDVLANDTHANSDTLTIASASVNVAEGTVAIVSNMIEFTPATGFTGDATITYVVEDETGDQDTGQVVVTVATAGGPWANAFDDWTGSLAYSRWINGATSGNSTQNSTMWSSRPGIGGSGDAVRWFTDGNDAGRISAGTKTYDGFDPAPFSGTLIMRFRVAYDATPTGKLYIYPQFNFMDGFSGYFDITPDATPSGSRGLGLSAGVSDVWFEEHASNGFWYFKARIDMAGATDTSGQIFWWLTDQDHTGDGLLDGGEALDMRVQDLTFEIE